MTVYLDLVVLLNFLVDWLLLLGTNRLCGYPPGQGRAALGAGLGSVYAGVCLLPGFSFMGNWHWRLISLAVICMIAFGFTVSALRRGVIFFLLSMALGGVAMGIGSNGFWQLIVSAVGVALLCKVGFPGKIGAASYIPIEISYGGKELRITALYDTGNCLKDPITGESVLVVGADVAQKLVGLDSGQLKQPFDVITAGVIPGLRLIPYRAVGQPCGMLLALRIENVKIGNRRKSTLVAFAPESLSCEGAYQGLTGGVVC